MKRQKILLGMSGGIDSSSSAYQLIQAGHEVIGISFDFLGNGEIIERAKKIANRLGISHYGFDCSASFEQKVINPFIEGYKNNETPNPCMLCNREMKFPLLFKWANRLGCDLIATGHYAKIRRVNNECQLFKSTVLNKDQSYFLYHLTQDELKKLIFPLEDYSSKDEVRAEIAAVLPEIAEAKESQGICFIPQKNHRAFLKEQIVGNVPPLKGSFLDENGNLMGRHQGALGFTIGQTITKGLFKKYCDRKWVILEIDNGKKSIIIGQENKLIRHQIHVDGFTLNLKQASFEKIYALGDLNVKIGGKGEEALGRIFWDRIEAVIPSEIIFYSKDGLRAPAVGQALAIYKNKRLLGGGRIKAI